MAQCSDIHLLSGSRKAVIRGLKTKYKYIKIGNAYHEVIILVKGISKQVIVVQSPEEKLFEQAIFILNEKAVGGEGITEASLLKQANRYLCGGMIKQRKRIYINVFWALAGALAVAIAWIATVI